jgi:NitT/TauT family transport system substrate-binding protein
VDEEIIRRISKSILTRRHFLKCSAYGGASLLFGIHCPKAFGSSIKRIKVPRFAVEYNTHAACFYIAKEKGWFEEEGMELTYFESHQTGWGVAAALARGDIKGAYLCLAPSLLIYNMGVPIKILIATHLHGYGIVANPKIQYPDELHGKTIGCMREGLPPDLLFHQMKEKFDLKEITLKRMEPSKQVMALISGSVDGACLPEHYVSIAESKGFPVLIKSQDLWPGMPGSVLAVRSDWFKSDDIEIFRRLYKLTQRGTQALNDKTRKNENAEVIGKILEIPAQVASRSMERLEYRNDLEVGAVQKMIDYMATLSYLKKGLRAEDLLIDPSNLRGIQ